MTKIIRLFFCLLILAGYGLLAPKAALAFSCTSDGVAIGGAGTFTIPIDVKLNKSADSIELTDMSAYTTCSGDTNSLYRDALRTSGATIASSLSNAGFEGYVQIEGTKYGMPPGQRCAWPDAACTVGLGANVIKPLNLQIGITRYLPNFRPAVAIPAGTEIARITVQQRSQTLWGWDKTWIFVLKNDLVIPAYTCNVERYDETVRLASVSRDDILKRGAGKFPDVTTPVKFDLTCDPQTTVSVQFDGTKMAGMTDVLANTYTGNSAIGIQLLFNNVPVKFGQSQQVIASAQAKETLSFDAYYYYKGGALSGGPVRALSTFTFNYK